MSKVSNSNTRSNRPNADTLLSVVIPIFDEQDNIKPLLEEITASLYNICDYEIIYVNDGSLDASLSILMEFRKTIPQLRVVNHIQRAGQSAALRSGIMAATGQLIATLDGDGQNDPSDIPKLLAVYRAYTGPSQLMVTGHRVTRKDSWAKRSASRLANAIRRLLLRDDNPDTGCSLKIYERQFFLTLPYFNNMHRYLPALARRENCNVTVVPVNHRHRTKGYSKYANLGRLLASIPDLLGVMWLIKRAPRNLKSEEKD